ncbi:MAG: N-acetyltransferase [Alphaproteobacteria bacterium]|nr:N-acetyltransferase [Alphaproteobacteria bacterium]
MFRLSPETKDDEYEVEYLFDLAFAPGREALSSYRLREGVAKIADLSLVARDETDGIAGAIRYWPVLVGGAGEAALLLGPVAVHPTHQGEGLGASLIWESLAQAKKTGWERVILVGDAPYYGRFGFQRASAISFPPPYNPDRLLALALLDGGLDRLSGRVRKYPAFSVE